MPSQASPASRWTRLCRHTTPRHTTCHKSGFEEYASDRVEHQERQTQTSKSCKLRISSSGGRELYRSFRRLSSSEMLTSTFWTVPISTAPRLFAHINEYEAMCDFRERKDVLFLWWEIVGDSVWWMNWVVFLAVRQTQNGISSTSLGEYQWVCRQKINGTYVASFPAYFKIILLPPTTG